MAQEHWQGGRSGFPALNGYDHDPGFIDNVVKIIKVVDGQEVVTSTMPGYPVYDPEQVKRDILATENTAKHKREFKKER